MDNIDSRLAPSSGPESDDSASPFNFPPAEGADRLAFEPVQLRYRTDGLTPEKQRAFVEALADCGVVREAAARAGVSEQAVNRVRRRADARDFDRACEAAYMFGARRLRSIAYERAIEGTLKAHYYRGERVGEERVFDNRLLTYLLGKAGPELQPPEESRTVCEDWEAHMDALEQGLPAPDLDRPEAAPGPGPEEKVEVETELARDHPQVWLDDGIWWTYFPPPDGFDGEEEAFGDGGYQRTLTAEEEAAVTARNRALDEAELGRCCALRDRFFGLPPRGAPEHFFSREAENSETSETSTLPHPGPPTPPAAALRINLGEGEGRGPMNAEGREKDPPLLGTSKPPSPGILADEPPGAFA